jgi:hypothetical protein
MHACGRNREKSWRRPRPFASANVRVTLVQLTPKEIE